MYIDSHAHLSMIIKEKGISESFIIEEMVSNNVTSVVDISGTEEEFEHALSLKDHFNKAGIDLFFVTGIHPHESAQFIDSDLRWILRNSDSTIAIGEVGLDHHYDFSPREIQEKILRKMISIAMETKKPLIIHGRNAEERIIEILKEYPAYQTNILFHCYTGSVETAKKILDKGWYISFSGILTFKKTAGVSEVFDICPKENLLFETDSPFLSPVPFRGQTNTPGKVRYVYEHAAKILNQDTASLSRQVNINFKQLFNIKK